MAETRPYIEYGSMPEDRLPDADNLSLLCVYNPKASNAASSEAQMREIIARGWATPMDVVETSPDQHETAARVGSKLIHNYRKYDAVISHAGDGGTNAVGNAVHKNPNPAISMMAVVVGRNGGACDLHAMTQGSDDTYIEHLPGQQIRHMYPVEITASSPEALLTRRRKAFAHFYIGILADIVERLNGPDHRESRLLGTKYGQKVLEAATVLRGLRPFGRFDIVEHFDDETTPARSQRVRGVAMTLGNQMARLRIFPGDIYEPGYHQAMIPNLIGGAAITGQLLAGNPITFAPRTHSRFTITPAHKHSSVNFGYDGETFSLPLGLTSPHVKIPFSSIVTTEVSSVPLRIASRI